jgi:hypothetical protein
VILEFENSDTAVAELGKRLRARLRAWSVAPDVVDRAISTAEQVIQHLADTNLMTGSPGVALSYNDFDLTISIHYQGVLLSLPNVGVRKHFFLEEESFSCSALDHDGLGDPAGCDQLACRHFSPHVRRVMERFLQPICATVEGAAPAGVEGSMYAIPQGRVAVVP